MRVTARRIDGGVALRQAMNSAGLTLQALAARINETASPPVSFQLIGFLATDGNSRRETTTPRTADLIEDALSVARGTLFERVEIRDLSDSLPA
jgi:hypothetical protein